MALFSPAKRIDTIEKGNNTMSLSCHARWVDDDRFLLTETKVVPRPDQHSPNLYEADGGIKFLPDVGEAVNADEVLCAFRTTNVETSFASRGETIISWFGSIVDYHLWLIALATAIIIQLNTHK